MRKLFLFLIAVIAVVFYVSSAYSATRVKGYVKRDGTSVSPHYRSDKNSTKSDNYSTKGNINPYSGKKGTRK